MKVYVIIYREGYEGIYKHKEDAEKAMKILAKTEYAGYYSIYEDEVL